MTTKRPELETEEMPTVECDPPIQSAETWEIIDRLEDEINMLVDANMGYQDRIVNMQIRLKRMNDERATLLAEMATQRAAFVIVLERFLLFGDESELRREYERLSGN